MYGKLAQLLYDEYNRKFAIGYGVDAIGHRCRLDISELIFDGMPQTGSAHALHVSNPYLISTDLIGGATGKKIVFRYHETDYDSIETYIVLIIPYMDILETVQRENVLIALDKKEAVVFLEEGDSIIISDRMQRQVYTVVRADRELFLS